MLVALSHVAELKRSASKSTRSLVIQSNSLALSSGDQQRAVYGCHGDNLHFVHLGDDFFVKSRFPILDVKLR